MRKDELIYKIATKTKLRVADVEIILNCATESIIESMRNNEKVVISNFGTFEIKKRAAKKGYSFKESKTIDIEGKSIPYLRFSQEARAIMHRIAKE